MWTLIFSCVSWSSLVDRSLNKNTNINTWDQCYLPTAGQRRSLRLSSVGTEHDDELQHYLFQHWETVNSSHPSVLLTSNTWLHLDFLWVVLRELKYSYRECISNKPCVECSWEKTAHVQGKTVFFCFGLRVKGQRLVEVQQQLGISESKDFVKSHDVFSSHTWVPILKNSDSSES